MGMVVESDANGNIVIPVSAPPGTRYAIEQNGDAVTARPEVSPAEEWWTRSTVAQRIDWLESFLAGMPAGAGLSADDVRREGLY